MAEPARRARIRVHPRFGRRAGLPSAGREMTALRKLFGPTIPLAPALLRELWGRRLEEIDDELSAGRDSDDAEYLLEERAKVVDELAALGVEAPAVSTPVPTPSPIEDVADEAPTVIVTVGPQRREGRPRL